MLLGIVVGSSFTVISVHPPLPLLGNLILEIKHGVSNSIAPNATGAGMFVNCVLDVGPNDNICPVIKTPENISLREDFNGV